MVRALRTTAEGSAGSTGPLVLQPSSSQSISEQHPASACPSPPEDDVEDDVAFADADAGGLEGGEEGEAGAAAGAGPRPEAVQDGPLDALRIEGE